MYMHVYLIIFFIFNDIKNETRLLMMDTRLFVEWVNSFIMEFLISAD